MSVPVHPISFLRLVLPPAGPYCWVEKRPGTRTMRNRWCGTIEEIWGGMESASKEADTWVAMCSFKRRPAGGIDYTGARGASNIAFKRGFYVDLDHTTPSDGARTFYEFCKTHGLPYPCAVSSGHGVHFHWPLADDISPGEWRRYAFGLQSLIGADDTLSCADSKVTTDVARILRVPGTYNHKETPVPVEVYGQFFEMLSAQGGPYSLSRFAALIENEPRLLPVSGGPAGGIPCSLIHDTENEAMVRDALASIPNGNGKDQTYDTWYRIGAAVSELGWGDAGRRLWLEWSGRSSKHTLWEFENAWKGFPKYRDRENPITPGTLWHLAREYGFRRPPRLLPPEPRDTTGARVSVENEDGCSPAYKAYAAELVEMNYVKTPQGNIAQNNFHNAQMALHEIGIRGRLNLMTELTELYIPGRSWHERTDAADADIRNRVKNHLHGCDQGLKAVREALDHLTSNIDSYNPLLDKINALEWDGVERLDTWPMRYCRARDLGIHRSFASLPLIAAVRRLRSPGFVPFKFMLVLESKQNTGKSALLKMLGFGTTAEGGYFSDTPINFSDSRSVLETLRGVFLYEWAELDGHSKASDTRIKSLLSAPADRARLPYARHAESHIRRAIFIGTCNPQGEYLKDQTGACRYWPLRLGDEKFDLAGFEQDVDQLWAEAAHREPMAPRILDLPSSMEQQAMELQGYYTARPRLYDKLSGLGVEGLMKVKYNGSRGVCITTRELKAGILYEEKLTSWLDRDIGEAMRALGWKSYRKPGGINRGYFKEVEDARWSEGREPCEGIQQDRRGFQ